MKIGTKLTLVGLTIFASTELYKLLFNGDSSLVSGLGYAHYAGIALVGVGWLKMLANENKELLKSLIEA